MKTVLCYGDSLTWGYDAGSQSRHAYEDRWPSALEAAHVMSVTLSCDHRAVDGALGAELIGAFKTLIENPVMMVV